MCLCASPPCACRQKHRLLGVLLPVLQMHGARFSMPPSTHAHTHTHMHGPLTESPQPGLTLGAAGVATASAAAGCGIRPMGQKLGQTPTRSSPAAAPTIPGTAAEGASPPTTAAAASAAAAGVVAALAHGEVLDASTTAECVGSMQEMEQVRGLERLLKNLFSCVGIVVAHTCRGSARVCMLCSLCLHSSRLAWL